MPWPKTYRSWRRSKTPYPLTLVPSNETLPDTLDAHDVLIRIHAVALNYRDIAMLQEGKYPVPVESGGIAASDCAAGVVAVGSAVQKFTVGDRAAPTIDLCHLTGEERGQETLQPGGNALGTLREYAVFEEHVLVKLLGHLSWEEASTLPCTGITAWVSLNGLKHVPKDATALTQACENKEARSSVEDINYKSHKDIAKEVLRLTQDNGVDFLINNTGIATFPDDIAMLRKKGTIALVGFLEGFDASFEHEILLGLMFKAAKLQGILGGSRTDFEALNAFVEEKSIRFDAIIDHVFAFDEVPAACEYLASGNHTGKVVIKIS